MSRAIVPQRKGGPSRAAVNAESVYLNQEAFIAHRYDLGHIVRGLWGEKSTHSAEASAALQWPTITAGDPRAMYTLRDNSGLLLLTRTYR